MGELSSSVEDFDYTKREMIGEPKPRPDGHMLEVYRYPSGAIDAVIRGVAKARYTYEQVLALGDGDEQLAAVRIGQAVFQDTDVTVGGSKPMTDKLLDELGE